MTAALPAGTDESLPARMVRASAPCTCQIGPATGAESTGGKTASVHREAPSGSLRITQFSATVIACEGGGRAMVRWSGQLRASSVLAVMFAPRVIDGDYYAMHDPMAFFAVSLLVLRAGLGASVRARPRASSGRRWGRVAIERRAASAR